MEATASPGTAAQPSSTKGMTTFQTEMSLFSGEIWGMAGAGRARVAWGLPWGEAGRAAGNSWQPRNNPLSALPLNSGRRWAGAAVPRAAARRTEERTDGTGGTGSPGRGRSSESSTGEQR